MRNRILVTAVLMVAIGGGAAESVATSPECERWIADYRQKLAQSHPVRAVEKQNGRLKKYVHRQIAVLTHKPKGTRQPSTRDPLRPRFSPAEMVKRFQVLCGDLPPVQTAQMVPPVAIPTPPITPRAMSRTTTPEGFTPTGGSNSPSLPGGSTPPGGGEAPPPPPVLTPPSGGGGGTPPVPPVPEPSTFALLFIGSISSAGWLMLRRKTLA